MPNKSKRQSQARFTVSGRWFNEEDTDAMDDDMAPEREKFDEEDADLLEKVDLLVIGILFEMCNGDCGSRKLSLLIYLLLRIFGQIWRYTDEPIHQVGAFRGRHAFKRAEKFLSGDFQTFVDEGRVGKVSPSFYVVYPDLEIEAKTFAVKDCSRKNASVTAADLGNFVDEKYYEITQQVKMSDDSVRSEINYRLDF